MRDISDAFAAALEREILYPIFFYEIAGSSGTLRLWTGFGDRDWNGETWNGIGWIIGMSEIEESTETRATSLTLAMPANTEVIATALRELKRKQPMTVWMGLLSDGVALGDPEAVVAPGDPDLGFALGIEAGALVDVETMFAGVFETAELDMDAAQPQVRLRYSSKIADLERPRERRQTPADQAIEYPGDRFYDYVGALSDKVLDWGGSSPPQQSGGNLGGLPGAFGIG